MADVGLLFQNKVLLLAQTFFIKDNRNELLLCAHKYDFDILFFDQMRDFVQAVEVAEKNTLFVIDLDVLHSMQVDMQQQKRQTMLLSDLLQRLPANQNYIYLQTLRQGERFLLQQKLVDSNCLAYAEKPISNAVLVDKLFNIFAVRQHSDSGIILCLGETITLDDALLTEHKITLQRCEDVRSLHVRVKELQPDLVLIDESSYQYTEALVRVLKKNIESDPSRDIILMQKTSDIALAAKALDSGFDDVLITNDAQVLTRRLVRRIQKIRTSKDLISRDRATGLLNKIGLQKKAQDAIRRAEREQLPLAYAVIDIDKFKTINDTWGHYFGDIVIKRLSLLLSARIGEQDLLSRFGGEEFVIVFWNCSGEQAQQRLDAMRQAFGALVFEVAPGDNRHFSFSGGIATYPRCKSENELFLQADAKLYQAKQNGRNQVCI